jgi:hypothetical protein
LIKFMARLLGGLAVLFVLAISCLWLWVSSELPTTASVVSRPMEACPVAGRNQPIELLSLPGYLPKAFDVAEQRFAGMLAATSVREAFSYRMVPDGMARWHLRNFVQIGRIKMTLTNDQILEAGLNQVYFGNGAFGLNCAAYRYFEKPASKLTISEAALLAGLPKGPSNYNPVTKPDRALERRNWIIAQLFQNGFISELEAKEAASNPIATALTK